MVSKMQSWIGIGDTTATNTKECPLSTRFTSIESGSVCYSDRSLFARLDDENEFYYGCNAMTYFAARYEFLLAAAWPIIIMTASIDRVVSVAIIRISATSIGHDNDDDKQRRRLFAWNQKMRKPRC
jgi:hypothetical protein